MKAYPTKCMLVVLLTATNVGASKASTITDGDFLDWSFSTYSDAPGASVMITREATGGNPGAHVMIATNMDPPGTGSAHGIAIYEGFSTDAPLQGANYRLSADARWVASQLLSGQHFLLVMRQGDTIYLQNNGSTIETPFLVWLPVEYEATLKMQEFGKVSGTGPANPELGGGVETFFGFEGANGAWGRTFDYDNVRIEYGPPCLPMFPESGACQGMPLPCDDGPVGDGFCFTRCLAVFPQCGWSAPDLPNDEPPNIPYTHTYNATSDALFVRIAEFPTGSSQPFVVTVNDIVVGSFFPGDQLDFGVRFAGTGGVAEFSVTATMDEGDLSAFALLAELDTAAAEFTITATALDSDEDGVADYLDNCTTVVNTDQRDTNNDGYGNVCDADLNNDCAVNFGDLSLMRSVFFIGDDDADLDGDGSVNFIDLGIMNTSFFMPPGPSGVPSTCDAS